MIIYQETAAMGQLTDTASNLIKECYTFFENEKLNIVNGTDYHTVLTTESYFRQYAKTISEGMKADELVNFMQLMENTRSTQLLESSTANIQQPFALSLPMLRKAFPRIGMKNAIPTEAVRTPKFVLAQMKQFIRKKDGTKLELPAALRNPQTSGQVLSKKRAVESWITIPNTTINLIEDTTGASVAAADVLDPVMFVSRAKVLVDHDSNGGTGEIEVEVPLNIKRDGNGNFWGAVTATSGSGTTTDNLMGHVDLQTGELTLASGKGKISAVKITAYITDESNNHGDSVGMDVENKEIVIGTGAHMNAPMGIEWIQDMMAGYQIDGAMQVIDLLSTVQAQKVDIELIEYIDTSFSRTDAGGAGYKTTFDLHPAQQFTGSPKDWVNAWRGQFDHLATKMKQESSMHTGYFAVIANPLDAVHIPNVDWIFTAGSEERAGVQVDYSLGVFAGANRFNIVTSDYVPQGKVRMIFVPTDPKFMTYKYFPYTFNIQNDYRDPVRSNIPNIMVTRRDTIEEMTPLVAQLTLLNNDGSVARSFSA